MFKMSKISAAALIALGGSFAVQAFAQDATLERVEVTGSSIKRIAGEGALPVTTLSQADIKKTGATTITDLIQALPSMQGFVPASSSVNGGGGGVTTASLHSLPSKYTLVLLDGQRVAPSQLGNSQGGGFGVNLETIPLDAIERVEILTDGASATYGSDAIAGVVNFILKKNKTDGEISATYNAPQHAGGGSWNASISKGFGNLDKDGFNVLLAYSHDVQDRLMASQRSFSAQGALFDFSSGGKNYVFDQRTGNTEPANISFAAYPTGTPAAQQAAATNSYSLNPYYTANQNCGSPLAGAQLNPGGSIGVSCRFNYAATVQDIPSSKRDSAFAKATFKLGDDATAWTELSLSHYDMDAQFAASAQPLGLSATNAYSTLFNKYVQPYLTANNLTLAGSSGIATMGYRSIALGGRTDDYSTQAAHFATGVDGTFKDWDYNASIVLSQSISRDIAAGGYSDGNQVSSAIGSGQYDPVLDTGVGSISGSLLNGQEFQKSTSQLTTLHLGAQHDLFQMAGGASVLALGGDITRTHFKTQYSDLLLDGSGFSTQPVDANGVPVGDTAIGGNAGMVPFDASRTNWGLFGEWLLPVTKKLEVTASARYDAYSKTYSKYVFDTTADANGVYQQLPNAKLGNTFNDATGKLSIRYTPVDNLLLRGSYGTGFKAPNLTDIAGAVSYYGTTQGTYACPFTNSSGCQPGSAQYDLLAGPNGLSGAAGLKPEKSKQWTMGFRADPSKSLSFGLDLWDVRLTDQVLSQGVPEAYAFNNPQTYAYLFKNPYIDPVGGYPTIAFEELPLNGGHAEYQGVDWDLSYRTQVAPGSLTVQWSGTEMLKQRYDLNDGQGFHSDLGAFGVDQQVVFRTMMNLVVSLQSGSFVNTLAAHYKSGYRDESYSAGDGVVFDTSGNAVDLSNHRVASYTTFDWQTRYTVNKALQITGGIKNLFDRNPPLTLQNGGGGNQIGYDGRYADPIGRQFYLTAGYKF